ncbi:MULTISPECIES: hypothetical protein [unclassified Escherichia]|uniref:hypothetical protein n=1 Tax=unclassified Escherichia TaxID=2608889 RepID=UPI00102923D0|nr:MULTISPECIES: hypothetical protein [unclassified Escherichia]RZN21805.1 hypothetical protein D9734_06050 [Escherichia sp. E14S1]
MSNTLNHTSSRQIVRHYTQPESGIKQSMQKIAQVNDCGEFICFKIEFLTKFVFVVGGHKNMLWRNRTAKNAGMAVRNYV